jgi:phospholipid/cholesterol/gamma-HCH transport system substrate-binding protein
VLTRRTKIQLVAFGVLSVFGVTTIAGSYLDLPHLLGFEQYHVTAEFVDASGLSVGAQVTYRGVAVGKVSSMSLSDDRIAMVRLAINDGVSIPADLDVQADSLSAIGEQYVELEPQSDGGPKLHDGAVIPTSHTIDLPATSALLDSVTALAESVPKQQTLALLSGLTSAFSGNAGNVASLLNSLQKVVSETHGAIKPTTDLIAKLAPFLSTQEVNGTAVRSFTSNLSSFTAELRLSDGELAKLVTAGAPAANAVTGLVKQVSPELPMLLYDLGSTAQVLEVYLPGVRQILVLYPALVAAIQTAVTPAGGADPASVHLTVRPDIAQPATCFTGYLPYSSQRDFNDLTTRTSIPPDLYCNVAPSDPRDVRGARNTPCLNNPGHRAASVEACLGVPIGSIINPIPGMTTQPVLAGTYDPVSGNVLAPNGVLYQLAGGGTDSNAGEVTTWQQLFLK